MPHDRDHNRFAFLKGLPGICVLSSEDGCHAYIGRDGIETTFGSRYDGDHFIWMGNPDKRTGFISDNQIDALLSQGRIVFHYSEIEGDRKTDAHHSGKE